MKRVDRDGDRLRERRVGARRRGDEPRGEKRGDEAALLLAPRGDRLVRLGQIEKAEREPLADVRALPPAGERRQIMSRDAGDRHRRIGFWRPDPRAVALEREHPHARDIGPRHPVAEALGHGAEVLADHHALGALALERDMADEVVERIGEVGAFRRPRALGDEEQALKPHRVIDAQHAGMAHVGAVDRA